MINPERSVPFIGQKQEVLKEEELVGFIASLFPENEKNNEIIKKTEKQLKDFYDAENIEKKYTIDESLLLCPEKERMFRIDMLKFEGREEKIKDLEELLKKIICEDIEKNKALSREKKEDIKTKIQGSFIKELLKIFEIIKNNNELHKEADLFEKVKTVILNKFLGKDFFIVRSSEYDDFINGIDNIIYEKTTGTPICAIDALLSGKEETRESKFNKVLDLNKQGGIKIEFGFNIQNEKIFGHSSTMLKNIPLFSIAVDKKQFENLLEKNDFFKENSSSEEKKFFYDNIITAFAFQFKALKEEIPFAQRNLKIIRKKFSRYFNEAIEYYKYKNEDPRFIKQFGKIIKESAEI